MIYYYSKYIVFSPTQSDHYSRSTLTYGGGHDDITEEFFITIIVDKHRCVTYLYKVGEGHTHHHEFMDNFQKLWIG